MNFFSDPLSHTCIMCCTNSVNTGEMTCAPCLQSYSRSELKCIGCGSLDIDFKSSKCAGCVQNAKTAILAFYEKNVRHPDCRLVTFKYCPDADSSIEIKCSQVSGASLGPFAQFEQQDVHYLCDLCLTVEFKIGYLLTVKKAPYHVCRVCHVTQIIKSNPKTDYKIQITLETTPEVNYATFKHDVDVTAFKAYLGYLMDHEKISLYDARAKLYDLDASKNPLLEEAVVQVAKEKNIDYKV